MTQQTPLALQPPARMPRPRLTVLLVVLLAGLVAWINWGVRSAAAQQPRPTVKAPAPRPAQPVAPAASPTAPLKVLATVNAEQITREDLARDCLRHHGQEVLERLVNKQLIIQECARRKITVTSAEVQQEIERMSGRFGLPTDQWVKMLQQERGITANQYASDIVWPTLALRKLAGERLQVSEEEVRREYESLYGPAVKARLIVCADRKKAEWIRAQAVASPESFGNLAKQYSTDPSASVKGLIQPIHQHIGDPQIEQVAFNMKDGEISPVISVANQCAILKREELIPERRVPLGDQLRGSLEEVVRDRKMRDVANNVFASLQKNARVENILNDPARSAQLPGVAAVINGQQVSVRELAEACIDRHGKDVLQGAIHRKLLEQACKKANITITEADLDEEVARAAALSLPAKPDGSPDLKGWLKLVTEQQGISEEIYRRDAVWPSVALKKLVGGKADVSQEDIQKGFEANYGPRVRCRAIVLDNLRRAQQVWDMARKTPTEEAFSQLAEQYSIEPSSRALRGEVPPIQRHGGQPVLEKEAFELKAGELSSVIQIDSRYVILFCTGRTEPVQVDQAAVRDLICQDIHEKKLRLAMADYFEKLKDQATIDNYLEGTSHSPKSTVRAPQTRPAAPVVR